MLAKTPLKDLAIMWAAQQPAHHSYDWQLGCRCVCAQFADSIGRRDEWDAFMRTTASALYPEWAELNRIAQGDPAKRHWTMGGFLTRLRESVNA